MTTIRIETRIDQIIRDTKNFAKGFEAGCIFTLGVVGYFAAKKKAKEILKKAEEKSKEEES